MNSIAFNSFSVLLLSICGLAQSYADQVSTVQGLIGRIVGQQYISKFDLTLEPSNGQLDSFSIFSKGDGSQVHISAPNGVALVSSMSNLAESE